MKAQPATRKFHVGQLVLWRMSGQEVPCRVEKCKASRLHVVTLVDIPFTERELVMAYGSAVLPRGLKPRYKIPKGSHYMVRPKRLGHGPAVVARLVEMRILQQLDW